MAYYEEKIRRNDKSGEPRKKHFETKDMEINKAEKANSYEFSSEPGGEKVDFLGMDDVDRIRREKLGHETR
jgi:hypothetical protein